MDKKGNITTKVQAISSFCEKLWKKLFNHQPIPFWYTL